MIKIAVFPVKFFLDILGVECHMGLEFSVIINIFTKNPQIFVPLTINEINSIARLRNNHFKGFYFPQTEEVCYVIDANFKVMSLCPRNVLVYEGNYFCLKLRSVDDLFLSTKYFLNGNSYLFLCYNIYHGTFSSKIRIFKTKSQ